MGITLVTTTAKRPYCFSILETWIKRQTVQPDQWLVIANDWTNYRFTMDQQVIRRDDTNDKLNPFLENWLAALPLIEHEKVLVAEDDDWYHETYIETVSALLDTYRLAGVKQDLYYKLPISKYMRMGNTGHASLAATGFTRQMLPFVERCRLHKSVFIDCYLWAEGTADSNNWTLIPNQAKDGRAFHVGMKMMPGGKGLGGGHSQDGATDFNSNMLRQWIGATDARLYQSIPNQAWDNPAWVPTEKSINNTPAIKTEWIFP